MDAPAELEGGAGVSPAQEGRARRPPHPSPLELTDIEHANALVGALAVAYAGSMTAFWLALAAFGGTARLPLTVTAILFSSFRHAGIFGVAVVAANVAYRRLGWPVALVPAVVLGFLVRLLGLVGDWIASRTPMLVDEGASYYARYGLGEVLWGFLKGLLRPGAHFEYGAVALGLVLAAYLRGRWLEGLGLSGPTTVYRLVMAVPVFFTASSHPEYGLASMIRAAAALVLIAVLLPICERIVRRAFLALGVRAPDE